MIRIKRIYNQPSADDGLRILVDRLWPRGLARERAHIDVWLKEVAPTVELRRWYSHDPLRWEEFRERYRNELESRSQCLAELGKRADRETITLLFAARDTEQNNAVVLKEVIELFHKGASPP